MPQYNTDEDAYHFAHISDIEKDCECGRFGIYEPKKSCPIVDTSTIDCILVPGVAFTKKGARLGFGAGIYDSLLNGYKGIKVGCAYSFQIVSQIPQNDQDVTMDYVMTNIEKIICNK